MPRFAANLSTLYPEHALVDRIAAAAADGFAAVEVQLPYSVEASEFRRAIEAARTQVVLINAPQGMRPATVDWLRCRGGKKSSSARLPSRWITRGSSARRAYM
jgi:hydroxypyruvate isomerase